MRWMVADSLYCPEQWFCSHLDSIGHYLREYGEQVAQLCWNYTDIPKRPWDFHGEPDVLFLLDNYGQAAGMGGRIKVAQVAAITNPLPWEVRKPDGTPAFDLVISSIPSMVEAARAAGCRAEYQALCFDLRARACMVGVKRGNKAIFIGTRGSNHRRREELLTELADIVEVVPPVFGAAYYRAIAGADALVQIHAEWSRGAANSLKMFEGPGMGASIVNDGLIPGATSGPAWGWNLDNDAGGARGAIEEALTDFSARGEDEELVLRRHTYECADRIPRLVELARSL